MKPCIWLLVLWEIVSTACHSPASMTAYEAASGKPNTVASPQASPSPGFFINPSVLGAVELTCPTAGVEIHYTLDGSVPTSASPLYTTTLALTTTTQVKAMAIKPGFPDSPVMTGTYYIGAQSPKIAISTYDVYGTKQIISVTDSYTSAFDIDAVYQYYTPASSEIYSNLTFHYGFTTDGTTPTVGSTTAPTDLWTGGSFLAGVYNGGTLLTLTGNDAQASIINYTSYPGWSDSAPVFTHLKVHYTGNLAITSGDPVNLVLHVNGNGGTDPVVSAVPYVGSTQIAYNALAKLVWFVNGAQVTAYDGSLSSTSFIFHIKNFSVFPAGTYNVTCLVQGISGTYSQSIQGIIYAP